MQCPNCGASMPEGFTFCTECGTTIDTQPAYEPEFTDYEDPAYTEEAKACIKKAKTALPMGIVALAAPFLGSAISIVGSLISLIPIFIWVPFITSPIGFFLGIAALVCMILGFVFSSKPLKSDIQPETIAAELYEKYLSAKKTAKTAKTLCIVALALMISAIVIAVIAGIAVVVVGGGVAAVIGILGVSGY